MKRNLRYIVAGWVLLSLSTGGGCGKPTELEQAVEQGMIPVTGSQVSFVSQCPYGTQGQAVKFTPGLWDCPIESESVALTKAPPELLLMADCKKRLITVRSRDRRVDTAWEVLPDLTFSFTVPGGEYRIQSVNGRLDCGIESSLEITGRLDCQDRDKVKILFDSYWRSTKSSCAIPDSCALHVKGLVRQCI